MDAKNLKLLQEHHLYWENHKEFQQALQTYLKNNNLTLPSNIRYGSGIDLVSVDVDGKPVLIISLPPISNYPVKETKYTDMYLRTTDAIAV